MKFGNGLNGAGPEGTGDVKRRLWMLSALVVLVFAVLALRLWYLQIVRGKYYRELSENNRVRIVNIRPPRGVLYDRNGIPLAANIPSYTIIFTPEDAKGEPSALPRLAGIIGLSKEELELRVRSEENRNPYSPIRVKENASFEEISKVEAHKDDLPGVMLASAVRRYIDDHAVAPGSRAVVFSTNGPGLEVADVLRDEWHINPRDVVALLNEKPRDPTAKILGSILSGPIDIDKMDYLFRDSLHAGVPYGRNFDQPQRATRDRPRARFSGLRVS